MPKWGLAEFTDPVMFQTPLEVIHRDVLGEGTRGQPILSDLKVDGTVFALVRQLEGKKLEIAMQLVPKASHMVAMAYVPGLTVRHQFRLGTRIFSIGRLNNLDEKGQELQATVVEEIPP